MSDYDEPEGIECPQCGGSQTEESRKKDGNWFCYQCGSIWNPETETYDQSIEKWLRWNPVIEEWEEQ